MVTLLARIDVFKRSQKNALTGTADHVHRFIESGMVRLGSLSPVQGQFVLLADCTANRGVERLCDKSPDP